MNDTGTTKVIIPPDRVPDRWKPVVAVINSIGVIFWCIATTYIVMSTRSITAVAANQNAYLGIVVPTVAYGILSLVAGIAAVNFLNSQFNFLDLMKGDGQSKIAGAIIWGCTVLGIAIIIHGVR